MKWSTAKKKNSCQVSVPCRATIRLAMQSGTLVPAAKNVMPIITSGMSKVKLMMVT